MTDYLQLIGLTLVGGIISLIGGALLLSRKRVADRLAHYATPFAAGALLAAVFLDLLKDGLEHGTPDTILLAALIGMLVFFFAERFLRWFHHHHEGEDESATVPLVIVGDTMHNALDGVAIAAAFLVSPATGIVTTLAVAAHEIPQEIGDFGLLLSKGVARRKVLLINIFSSLATTVAAILTYAVGSSNALPTDFLLGLSAGFLLYIAASDIIPSIHQHTSKAKTRQKLLDWQPLLLLLGVIIVGVSVNIAHRYIDDGHAHEETQHSEIEHHDETHEKLHEEGHKPEHDHGQNGR
jgi:zinc and cadmium transporter